MERRNSKSSKRNENKSPSSNASKIMIDPPMLKLVKVTRE
jgi:hypothetical protein